MHVTRIILARHGETAWNATARLQGHEDIALNAAGLQQAARLAQALAHEPLAAIYSSDLQRARLTAQPLADRLGLPVIERPGLRERHFGRFQGRTFDEVMAESPEDARRWRQREPGWAPPGGESLEQLRSRVREALDDAARPHAGQQILVVTHGGVLDALYREATGQDTRAPRTWNLGNAAIHRLLWTPDALTLVGWGDERHLEPASSLDERSA